MRRVVSMHSECRDEVNVVFVRDLVDAAMGAIDQLIDEATSTSAWDNLSTTEKSMAILEWNKSRKASERQGYPW